jgi:peptide/nickel transport system substrate-binding protein
MRRQMTGWVTAALLLLLNGAASAAGLTIGARFEPTVDPHFFYVSTNIAYARHVFDPLVDRDENVQKRPGLALSWAPIDDTTWEFKLRPGVKFHDGSDFTAEDVAFSVKRIPSIPNNPSPYTGNIRSIVATEIVDAHTIRFKTDRPNPSLPGQLSNVFIVSHKAAAEASPADFASGRAAIGTGPYKFASLTTGDRYVLTRFDGYWGAKPDWDKVTFRIIPNSASRVAALLAGDVDLIDFVPPADIVNLRKDARVTVFQRPSDRVIYLEPNFGLDSSPELVDKSGAPLDKNPFRDLKVRQAVSKAINREAMVARIMDGLGVPASQLVPEGFGGFDPAISVERYDPDGAKKLLAEAGYLDGFGLTVHCSSDRYVNDARICETVAQMLSRIGIAAKVEVQPSSVYFSRTAAPKSELPLMLVGWGSASTGDSVPGLTGIIHSYNAAKGMGAYDMGDYKNAAVDQLIEQAIVTLDDGKRDGLLKQAMVDAMKDLSIIPLHTQMSVLAARKGITCVPRADEQTVAMSARPGG